jgi:hypothetical protein
VATRTNVPGRACTKAGSRLPIIMNTHVSRPLLAMAEPPSWAGCFPWSSSQGGDPRHFCPRSGRGRLRADENGLLSTLSESVKTDRSGTSCITRPLGGHRPGSRQDGSWPTDNFDSGYSPRFPPIFPCDNTTGRSKPRFLGGRANLGTPFWRLTIGCNIKPFTFIKIM